MLLTSYKYGLFLLVAFAVFWGVARFTRRTTPRNLCLLVVSYGFYALWDPRWCLLLAGITASGYFGAHALERIVDPVKRHAAFVLVLATNLGALAAFKYFDFFATSFADLLARFGLRADAVTLGLLLPVGLSYYVFQNLSYVIDVSRRQVTATRDPISYAVALSFFSQLLAGPITRPVALLPQLQESRGFDHRLARDGLRQILWGITKKILIADNLATQVDYVWAHAGSLDGLSVVIATVLYSVQIYCDFSGYADIAIGSAKLFNLRLTRNFDYPYFAPDIQKFWRRWHITLSSWMRDYVYIPLGGNRVAPWRQAFNVIATFAVVGLWHGASLTFVVWGLLHGVYSVVWSRARRDTRRSRRRRRAATAFGVCLTFSLVTFAWVFFRAPDMRAAADFLGRIFVDPYATVDHLRYVPSILAAAGLLGYEVITRHWEHGLAIERAPTPVRWAAYAAVCLSLLVLGNLGSRAGIYVQF
jgi:alginate O-acetyltransferase complex protein AlgI